MTSHVAWNNIRADHIARAGGEAAVEAGKRQLLAEVIGHRLAEIRRTRGLTQQQVADHMGVIKGRVSQIERGKISGQEVLARHATALGCRLHQSHLLRRRRHHRHRLTAVHQLIRPPTWPPPSPRSPRSRSACSPPTTFPRSRRRPASTSCWRPLWRSTRGR
jgi:transcriptional regulator with XRE-family HTH domain